MRPQRLAPTSVLPATTLMIWTAEPGSKSAHALSLLGSWAATPQERADVARSARLRLYRALASEPFVLAPQDERLPFSLE